MKSVMSHQFGQVPLTNIERSTFDRSHGVKTTLNSGYLVPFYVDEVLPGDEFKISATQFARMLSPLVTSPMDNLFLDTFYFFVPSRLVWNNWQKFMGERVNPKDSINYTVPFITAPSGGFQVGSLADYFGIPTGVAGLQVNSLPFRAYHKCWDDWFRDENLQDSVIQDSTYLDDNEKIDWNFLHRRCKRPDYFTKCLPSPQKGAGVELPLGVSAPVYGDGNGLALTSSKADPLTNSQYEFLTSDGGSTQPSYKRPSGSGYYSPKEVGTATSWNGTATQVINGPAGVLTKEQSRIRNADGTRGEAQSVGLQCDLTNATAITINSLRQAFQIQRLLETDARCGTRYIEIILGHFKTVCPDGRLQRSEYLGGSSTPISISTNVQTSATSDTTPQGNIASIASVSSHNGFRKAFTEHGYVIGVCAIRADLNYQQGLNKIWSRSTRYDFYWPTLAHLGEQAVLNKEIFAQGPDVKDANGNVIDELPFGYQERYAEYRYHPSIITGQLRSTFPESLDTWHFADKFANLPKLNAEFIEDNPPIRRALAVTDPNYPEFVMDCYIKCICTRPMPLYSVPGLVDHF